VKFEEYLFWIPLNLKLQQFWVRITDCFQYNAYAPYKLCLTFWK